MNRIDLNCDLGEGVGNDAELMPLITSANVACGAHAGDRETMRSTVRLAVRHGVAIGAHPGFADRVNFGRREIPIAAHDAAELVLVQFQALQDIAAEVGVVVGHIKLHGALYNMAARDASLAEAIVQALKSAACRPALYVLAGSELERIARLRGGIRVVPEVFADRTYQRDGSLTPRQNPDALIHDETMAAAQILRIVRHGVVRATDGVDVPIRGETVCLHGDAPHAVSFARRLRDELAAAGVVVGRPAG